MKITDMARRRIEVEVDPILANRRRGLGRYTEALEVISQINAEIKAAARWWNPLTWPDVIQAYGVTSAKAKFIGAVCAAVAQQMVALRW